MKFFNKLPVTKIIQFRNKLSASKHLINRGYSYVGVLGIGIVIAHSVQEILRNASINMPIYILYPAGIIILIVIGWFDTRYGFHTKELEYATSENKYLIDKIDAIQASIKEERKRKRKRKQKRKLVHPP